MILLADSGSTKTDWVLLDNGLEIESFRTQGLNPYFVQTGEVIAILNNQLLQQKKISRVKNIYFYGAGCSSDEKNKVIGDALDRLFPESDNMVAHDMLAAARALFGNHPGIACILGTGSNSCVYDGKGIRRSLFSLGYMFGDEGSGAHLGKSFIASYLKKTAPQDVMDAFLDDYKLSDEEILTHIYRKANPNRFLASFTHFLKKNEAHPFISSLVFNCFEAFFSEQIMKYPEKGDFPIGCIGSVAYHFKELFKAAANNSGLEANLFLVSPMEGLIKFHNR